MVGCGRWLSDVSLGFVPRDTATFFWFAAHALLSVSSLVFQIPTKRQSEGTMIWPLYRAHAIIFSLRSIANLCIIWAAVGGANELHVVRSFINAATLLSADVAIASAPSGERRLVRGWPVNRAVQLMFSYMQFVGSSVSLAVPTFNGHFWCLVVIQLNAFLFTIRRKGYLSNRANMWIYGILLSFAGFNQLCSALWWLWMSVSRPDASYYNIDVLVSGLAVSALMIRVSLPWIPKYLLWAFVDGWLYRQQMGQATGLPRALLFYGAAWGLAAWNLRRVAATAKQGRVMSAGQGNSGGLYFTVGELTVDISSFIDDHPGGRAVLLGLCGQDATEAFEDVGHSLAARAILRRLAVAPPWVPLPNRGAEERSGPFAV